MNRCNEALNPQTEVLRRCAAIELETEQAANLADAVMQIREWEGFVERANDHGLAPLVYRHLSEAGISLPAQQSMQLRGLTLRHRRAHEIRSRALREAIDAFGENRIETVVLKGAALSHLIYPIPELRPMSDLDVLVPGERAPTAQNILTELGYLPLAGYFKFAHEHHHLPVLGQTREGLQISVEVHTDALSSDVPGSIGFDNFTAPPLEFSMCYGPALALGHSDMLRHLCHHTFEPMAEVKLISVTDITGYATRFLDDIDWSLIRERYPFVINTLRCLAYLAPVSRDLQKMIGTVEAPPPRGIGYGLKPISQTIDKSVPIRRMFRELFYPSDWWLHVYYGVDPGARLWWVRWGAHPARIGKWLYRRLRASLRYQRIRQ